MDTVFNKPDLNAPRFRNKRVNLLTRDVFEKFISKHPEYKGITLSEFKKIIQTFNGNLYQGVIDNRDGVELPHGLGFIFMGACPPAKSSNINYKTSMEYGIKAKHRNWESDNKLLKIFYTNRPSKYPLQNKQVWAFKAVKQFRKSASEAFKQNWPKYIEVDDKKKVSSMFAQVRKRDFIMKSSAVVPKDWDEFKM